MGQIVQVLVIEDDDDVSLLYRLALEGAGHLVHTAATGREGLRLVGEHLPDVVVLDGMLPDLDGLEVLTSLRAAARTADIPVVMASARVGSSDQRAALDRGAAAYVVKPFDPLALAQILEDVRRGAPEATPGAAAGAGPAAVVAAEGRHRASPVPTDRTQPGLSELLNLASDAIVSVDHEQRIVGFNKGAEATFGYLAEEVMGKPLDLLIPEALVDAHRAHVRHFSDGEAGGRLMGAQRDISARRRDGTEFPAEASITKLEIDGQPVLAAILRDASARRRTEAELRNRAEQQAAVAELGLRAVATPSIPALLDDAVATLVRVLSVELVNVSTWDARAEELVMAAGAGWEPGIVGTARCRTGLRALGGVTLAAEGAVLFDDIEADTRFEVEPHLRSHGVVSGVHVALRSPARPIGLVGVYTRARRAFTVDDVHVLQAIANVVASALQREAQERRLRAFLDAAPDATLVVDGDGRIVSANAQAEELFGRPRDELTHLSVDALVPDAVRSRHAAHRATYATERRPRPMGAGLVLSARRSDGAEVPVDIMLRPLDTEEGRFVVAAIRDVTDRRRQEAARDAFLHAVSHELRTPLTAVVGFASLMAKHYSAELAEEGVQLVRRIQVNAEKLERLLGDLLDLDRLGRGVLTAHRRDVSMLTLARHAVDAVDLGSRSLRVDIDRTLRAEVDPAQVERILENLLVNAVRHTPSGSHIELRIARSTNGILLVVDDDGPGVAPELREQIFEPFRRNAAVATTPGTGVGLSLVARFAELHGGRAWVEASPGGGASFRVVLAT